MCFYNDDYDWCAEVIRTTEGTDGPPTRCIECGAKIAAGDWRRHIEQIEHESCQICEDDCSESFDPGQDPATCEHNYGETWDGDTCRRGRVRRARWRACRCGAVGARRGCGRSVRSGCVGSLPQP